MGDMIELSEKFDRLQIFPAPVLVGDPLTVATRVIKIEHRGDRIDPQPVNVKALAPIEGVRQQKVTHFMPPVIEDQRAPILVRAFSGVFMLVQRSPIKARQSLSL